MSESYSGAVPVETPLPGFKNRSTGLMIFGIMTILLGCVAGLFTLMALAQVVLLANLKTQQFNTMGILPAVVIYGVLAVALVWLGIGSIMARRWARALLLIFSWSWLIVGIIMVISMAFVLPKIFNLANVVSGDTTSPSPALPPGFATGMIIGMLLFFSVFFILLPAIWVFFYNSRHVKATCEARDPAPCWTDACPLPVLGLCLWILIGIPFLALMPLIAHGVVPFCGMFLSGAPGSLLCLAVAVLWAYCAWQIYKLNVHGWWLFLAAMVFYFISSLVTFSRHDTLEMYQLMGYPQAQIDQIQKMGFMTGNHMVWFMAFSMVPFIGYILFVKKYFRKNA